MSLIAKEYFTLAEVVDQLAIPWADIVYLAENGHLRLSVLVYGLWVEIGHSEQFSDEEWHSYPYRQFALSGLLDLKDREAHLVLKHGQTEVRHFHADANEYCSLTSGAEPLTICKNDLLLRKAERENLAAMLKVERARPHQAAFGHSPDYRMVTLSSTVFRLGLYQADVIRQLHEALLAGTPWQRGCDILFKTKCASMRMADLFKSQKNWRQLVLSDGKGLYRLAIPDRIGPGSGKRKK